MNPDVYRGLWGGSHCRDSPVLRRAITCECIGNKCVAADKYFHQMENTIKYSLPKSGKIAAFIAESIQVFLLFYRNHILYLFTYT